MTSFPDAVTQTLAEAAAFAAELAKQPPLERSDIPKLAPFAWRLVEQARRVDQLAAELSKALIRIEALEAHTTALRRLVERNASEWR